MNVLPTRTPHTFREHYLGAYSLDAQRRGMEKVDWL